MTRDLGSAAYGMPEGRIRVIDLGTGKERWTVDTLDGGRPTYHWTLIGTNSGPGGTGKAVRISGFEKWTMRGDRIGASVGHFDSAEYQRQLHQD